MCPIGLGLGLFFRVSLFHIPILEGFIWYWIFFPLLLVLGIIPVIIIFYIQQRLYYLFNKPKTYPSEECVVCLEKKPEILYPCGHLVVCSTCDKPLTECPMCRRSKFEEIIQ